MRDRGHNLSNMCIASRSWKRQEINSPLKPHVWHNDYSYLHWLSCAETGEKAQEINKKAPESWHHWDVYKLWDHQPPDLVKSLLAQYCCLQANFFLDSTEKTDLYTQMQHVKFQGIPILHLGAINHSEINTFYFQSFAPLSITWQAIREVEIPTVIFN